MTQAEETLRRAIQDLQEAVQQLSSARSLIDATQAKVARVRRVLEEAKVVDEEVRDGKRCADDAQGSHQEG